MWNVHINVIIHEDIFVDFKDPEKYPQIIEHLGIWVGELKFGA